MNPEQLAKSGTEHAEQMALFCWANKALVYGFEVANNMQLYNAGKTFFNSGGVTCLRWLHAIPNAGARGNKVAAAQLKAEGVKAGIADIFLPYPRMNYNDGGYWHHGLYIELKRANGVPSDVSGDQIEFASYVTSQGYIWVPCFGWREAALAIQEYVNECVTRTLTKKQAQVLDLVIAG